MAPVTAWSADSDHTNPADLRSDATLIEATRAGDSAAYGELFRRHAHACLRLACRLCESPAAADDVVSEVFTNTLRAIQAGSGPQGDFAPYVLCSVRHQAQRTRSRGDGRYTVTVDPTTLDPPATDDIGSADTGVVEDAFERLPHRFRQVLWLAEVEGHPYATIGEQLDLRPTAVAALVRRARDAFCRTYLDAHTAHTTVSSDCRTTRNQLAAYVRGPLSDSSCQRIEHHLERCDDCTTVVNEMRHLDETLRSMPWLGVVTMSRWAALFGRTASLGSDIGRLAATVAVGITAAAGPPATTSLTDDARHDPVTAAAHTAHTTHADTHEPDSPSVTIAPPAAGLPSATSTTPADLPPPAPTTLSDGAATTTGPGTRPSSDALSPPPAPPASSIELATEPRTPPAEGGDPDGGDLVELEVGIGSGLVDLDLGDGLVEASVATPEHLAHLSVGSGLVDVTVGAPDELAHVDIGDGLAEASLATPEHLAHVTAAGELADVTVNATIDPHTATVGVADVAVGPVDVGAIEVDVDDVTVTVGSTHVDVGGTVEDTLATTGQLLGGLLR